MNEIGAQQTAPIARIDISLTIEELNIVLMGLGKLPGEQMFQVTQKIHAQARPQLQPVAIPVPPGGGARNKPVCNHEYWELGDDYRYHCTNCAVSIDGKEFMNNANYKLKEPRCDHPYVSYRPNNDQYQCRLCGKHFGIAQFEDREIGPTTKVIGSTEPVPTA